MFFVASGIRLTSTLHTWAMHTPPATGAGGNSSVPLEELLLKSSSSVQNIGFGGGPGSIVYRA